MKPTSLSIFVDYRCNFNCDHCSVGSTSNSTSPLSLDSSKEILNRGRELGFRPAAFTGGEPTLALDNLITLIKHAKSVGYITRVVSNGWWAKDEDAASLMLTKLKTARLDEINMSFDDFHLDLPKERWKAEQRNLINVARASSSLGMKFGIRIIKKRNSVVIKDFVVNYFSGELGINVRISHICYACGLLTTQYRNEMIGYFRDHRSDILVNNVLLNPRARESVIMACNKGLL